MPRQLPLFQKFFDTAVSYFSKRGGKLTEGNSRAGLSASPRRFVQLTMSDIDRVVGAETLAVSFARKSWQAHPGSGSSA